MNKFLKIFFVCSLLMGFASCGGDSSSSDASDYEDEEISSSSKSTKSSDSKQNGSSSSEAGKSDKDSDSSGEKSSSSSWQELSSAEVLDVPEFTKVDTSYADSATGVTYKTVNIGTYTWISEPLKAPSDSVKGLCYDYENKNCDKYGRLYYRQYNIQKICPKGFSLANSNVLMAAASTLNLPLGGYCVKGDTVSCHGKDTSGYYFTSDYKLVVVDSEGNTKTEDYLSDGFYNTMCFKFTGIVTKRSELSNCFEGSYSNDTVYVTELDSTFYCSYGKWEPVTEYKGFRPCRDTSMTYWDGTTLWSCTDNRWQIATPSILGEECNPDIEFTQKKFNERTFVCRGGWYWIATTELEDEIGVCHPGMVGKVDTTKAGEILACRPDNVWWEANYCDVIGECDSTKLGKIYEFEGVYYTCRTTVNYPDYISDLEMEIGACHENIENKVQIADTTIYVCQKGSWRIGNDSWVLPTCNNDRYNDIDTVITRIYQCQRGNWKVIGYTTDSDDE